MTALLRWMLVGALLIQASATGLSMQGNPVRKVVAMMQRMQAQVEAEGKEKTKMFEDFLCYCKDGGKNLESSISAADEKIPQLESTIKESKSAKEQLESDLKQGKADRAEAVKALGDAKAIREKEASDFAAEAAESKTNIAALAKAIPAIEQGTAAAFIQSNSGATEKLRQLSVSMDMEAVDRDLLASFLADGSTSRGSGEILGILKQMHDEMTKDLSDLVSQEKGAVAAYESLVASKKKQKSALTKSIETKTVRVGEHAVKLAEKSNDLEDTQEALAEDQKMKANLKQNCKIKGAEFEEYKKLQAAELVALADTIKLLNDDDALDLFKKTLPSGASSFMQVMVTSKSMQRRALAVLRATRKHGHVKDHRLDFLEIALHGGQVGFDKILNMIDGLMGVLQKEQVTDDDKKQYCAQELDKNEDIAKDLNIDISDISKAIGDGEETFKTLSKEIADLMQGIKDLDASVARATATRKLENQELTKTLSDNGAAKELLEMAKNRLNKFYNPALHKAAPKRELSEMDAVSTQFGGEADPVGANFVQVEAQRHRHHRAADMSFKKKGPESTGVIAMIDMLIRDVTKDNTIAETEEKDAQKDYETFMADAKGKRAGDAKAITDKEGNKAAAEASLGEDKSDSKDKTKELSETKKMLMGLHQECDWLVKFYDTRKEARSDEIESLDKAKSVLKGADYSFLQIGSSQLRGSK